jgi:hypothetical protein
MLHRVQRAHIGVRQGSGTGGGSRRLSLDEVPTAFAKFDAREDGYIKVVLKLGSSGLLRSSGRDSVILWRVGHRLGCYVSGFYNGRRYPVGTTGPSGVAI